MGVLIVFYSGWVRLLVTDSLVRVGVTDFVLFSFSVGRRGSVGLVVCFRLFCIFMFFWMSCSRVLGSGWRRKRLSLGCRVFITYWMIFFLSVFTYSVWYRSRLRYRNWFSGFFCFCGRFSSRWMVLWDSVFSLY